MAAAAPLPAHFEKAGTKAKQRLRLLHGGIGQILAWS